MTKFSGVILPNLPEAKQRDPYVRDMHLFHENLLRVLNINPSDILYTETAPDTNIETRRGQIALYNNSGTYTTWINLDGARSWQEMADTTELANKALSNLASVAINLALLPGSDDAIDLGSAAKEFRDLYIDRIARIDSLIADTADINAGSIDGVAIGLSVAAALACTTLALGGKLTAGANEIEGSNFDINGGKMDGVQIGGMTATGEIIVNNASDQAAGLGSQGTDGQHLRSKGAGVNPIFEDIALGVSNCMWSFALGNGVANVFEGALVGAPTGIIHGWFDRGTAYSTVIATKWKKVATVNTITWYSYLHSSDNIEPAYCNIDVGGQSSAAQTPSSHATKQWITNTIDVSGLSNGTVYDIVIQLKNDSITHSTGMYSHIAFGS